MTEVEAQIGLQEVEAQVEDTDIDAEVSTIEIEASINDEGISAEAQIGDINASAEMTAPTLTLNWMPTEIPTGLINGTNTEFFLSAIPATNSLFLWYSGRIMHEGVDYTLVGKIITFEKAPLAGRSVFAKFAT